MLCELVKVFFSLISQVKNKQYLYLVPKDYLTLHLGSFTTIRTVGNSDRNLFLATELILGGMIMRRVHNG